MELKIFFRLLLKRWWIIVLILIVTVVGALVFTYTETPIYSSSSTYVVTPSSDLLNGTSYLSGLSVLGGQPTVTNTYASIATSTSIKQTASLAMSLSPAQVQSLIVSSRVQTGTNVIEITVEGKDPLLVQAFTNKIGEGTIDYVSKLNGVFTLARLDDAVFPDLPIKPNKKLNLVLGVALGLALGGGIVFLMGLGEY